MRNNLLTGTLDTLQLLNNLLIMITNSAKRLTKINRLHLECTQFYSPLNDLSSCLIECAMNWKKIFSKQIVPQTWEITPFSRFINLEREKKALAGTLKHARYKKSQKISILWKRIHFVIMKSHCHKCKNCKL